MSAPHDLSSVYLHLAPTPDGAPARQLPVTPSFWATIDGRDDLDDGYLMMKMAMGEDWPTDEIHPHGDEILVQLSGEMTVHLYETPMRSVRMGPGDAVIVPANTWHTATVHTPGETVFLTPGRGTLNRPREA